MEYCHIVEKDEIAYVTTVKYLRLHVYYLINSFLASSVTLVQGTKIPRALTITSEI